MSFSLAPNFLSFENEDEEVANSLTYRYCLTEGMIEALKVYSHRVETSIAEFYRENDISPEENHLPPDILGELNKTRDSIMSQQEDVFDGLFIYVQHLESVILALYQAQEDEPGESLAHLTRVELMNKTKEDIIAKEKYIAFKKAEGMLAELRHELANGEVAEPEEGEVIDGDENEPMNIDEENHETFD
ncbi:hypothetical protein SCHPADRAFT_910949 [Schizopora paradoxa]|uniref:Uncharacterized protein n=1 Tax=Schizopora paradoxa TaxID=27342 RepID=A0A0H2R7U7_9AGAM|nr:hypothetical protein SCHPADRAFT_910949 [Schizopora paradoxa]